MENTILSEPIERRNRLTQLGLDEEELLKCIGRGQGAWAECTDNHPALFRGVAAWAETICAIREYLLPKSWKRVDDGNLPLTVNKSGTIAIIVWTGDEATGRVEENPSTKSSKGPRAADAVEGNLRNTLFGDIRKVRTTIGGRVAYVLLFHRDLEAEEVRAELSQPVKINEEDGRVDGWVERIILGSIPFGGDRILKTPDAPQTPNINIEIKRRSA